MTDPRDTAITDALRTIDRQQAVIDGLRHQRDQLDGEVAMLRGQLAEAAAVVDLLKPADRPVWQQ